MKKICVALAVIIMVGGFIAYRDPGTTEPLLAKDPGTTEPL